MDIRLYPNAIPYNAADPAGRPTVTAFLTESWYPLPAVIVLPGGAYTHLAEHEANPIAAFYQSCGYHAFVLRYRLLPNLYPAALCDVQRLIKHLRANAKEYKVDPDKIFVIGFSAGGHLAGMSAVAEDICHLGDDLDKQNHKPNGVLLGYPVVNIGHKCVQNIADHNEALFETLSVEKQVRPDTPPMFIWHTSEDKTVDVRQSLSLGEALRANGIPFEMHIYPHGNHGLGLATHKSDIKTWTQHSAQWLEGLCNV